MSNPDSFDKSILESAGYSEEEIDNYFKEMEDNIVETEKCICIDGCKYLLPSKLPNINDRMKKELQIYPFLKTKNLKTLILPVLQKRLSEEYEKKRLKKES